ncbi:hypothetical protein FOMA001_g20123 [Fusarium oxysporum f. sp. matthiolae]|nr:hypothetical protein FOMA001_g20123 [Fusarium oxysporum f. sp. matthiolae]
MSAQSPWPPRPNDRRGFKIAIICALSLEADAVEALFDHHWDDDGPPFDKELGDPNAYSTGVIGRHNVILAYMPGMGKVNAAAVASNCGKSFPSIRLALVVGVCGAVPFKPDKDEIVLGDVIISNGIIQYDFGRQLPDRFVRKDTLLDSLGRPNHEIRAVLAKLGALRHRRQLSAKMADYLNVLRQDPELRAEYPGTLQDRLFEASYLHTENQKSCEQLGCNGEIVSRSRLETAGACPTPAVHIGLMGSGDLVMKSGKNRDQIAADEGVIGFEMEGAGVWDSFPCIVIKGACDYADSHKSKVWQRYAAATAAACVKAVLSFWVPSLDQVEDISCLATNFEGNLSLQSRYSLHQSQSAHAVDERQMQPVFRVPFSKNGLFVGRDDILTRLQDLFFGESRQKVALVGLGGIGKTQTALQLAYWVTKNKQDYSVFWLPVLSRASFEQACVQIIDVCNIPTADSDNAIEAVRQYLSSRRAGKWLLVVDNADDAQTVMGSGGAESGIYRSLPQSDEGRILFTTRYRKLAVSVAGRNILEVPAMSQNEARSYFEEALIQEISLYDDQVINRLLTLLTHLPLAITQAAAYINENQISAMEYLQLFENTDRDRIELLSAEFQDDTRYEHSQDPVATTWFISFNQIRTADKLAWRILMFLSCVEPKAVPQSMLPKSKSQQQLTRAIGTLCGYRFLDRRGSSETFDMHSLVHLAIRSWVVENDSQKEQSQAAIARLSEVFPTDEWENRDLWRQYLPHALRLLRTVCSVENKDSLTLGFWVGRCLLIDGRAREAVSTLKHVVAVREKALAEDDPERLASQHALAGAYLADKQVKKAIKMLEGVVAIKEKALAEDDPSRLASRHELARAYLGDEQVKKAIGIFEGVVAAEVETLAEDDTSRQVSQHVLARAYLADKQVKKAIEMLEGVVAINKKILAEDDPSRLASQHELARAYLADKQVKKAIKMLEGVVAIKEKILAEDDPERLASQHELAQAYLGDEQVEKAIEIFEGVVAIDEKILAEDDPSRLVSQHVLAQAYLADKQVEKAIEMLEGVVAIKEKILAEDDPSRLASQHVLARAYLADEQVKKAIKMLEGVVAIKEKILAEDDPSRLVSQHELSRAYLADEQVKKAIEMLEDVVAAEAETLEEDNPSRQASKNLLQRCYERLA